MKTLLVLCFSVTVALFYSPLGFDAWYEPLVLMAVVAGAIITIIPGFLATIALTVIHLGGFATNGTDYISDGTILFGVVAWGMFLFGYIIMWMWMKD